MIIINLTPHTINVCGGGSYASSGVARVSETETQIGTVNGIPLFRKTWGPVVGLPAPQPDTIYIVSAMVKAAAGNRSDLLVPTKLVRDENGNVIGCQGFA